MANQLQKLVSPSAKSGLTKEVEEQQDSQEMVALISREDGVLLDIPNGLQSCLGVGSHRHDGYS